MPRTADRTVPTSKPFCRSVGRSAYYFHSFYLICRFLSEKPQSPLLPQHPQITCDAIPNDKNIDQPFDFNVSTTNELLKIVEQTSNSQRNEVDITAENRRLAINVSNNNSEKEVGVSTYDMINPVIGEKKAGKIMYDFYNSLDGDGNDYTNPNPTKTARTDNELAPIEQRVNWDNMFDTELLPVATDAKLIIQQNAISTAEHKFNIVYSENITDKACKISAKTKETKHNDVKNVKRKVQPRVTDVIPKKVKKTSEIEKPKHSFRKHKYTKTVKNWLDDVNPNNPVEEEVTDNKIQKISKQTDLTVLDTKKDKPNKKVVQAQLANKDGKMKFGKPKDKVETETLASKTDKSDKVKDKKTKLKFVAPIKSQVPVREVAYEVVTVGSTNIRKDTESLCSTADKDLVFVLVYRYFMITIIIAIGHQRSTTSVR